MLRAIREIRPRYVVGENVRGIISWDGGVVFDEVQADLENEGYEVIPCVLPACGVNAPHRRERVWFIAYRHNGIGQKGGLPTGREVDVHSAERSGIAAHTDPYRRGEGLRNLSKTNGNSTKWNEDAQPCSADTHYAAANTSDEGLQRGERRGGAGAERESDGHPSEYGFSWTATYTAVIGLRRQSDGVGEAGQFNQKSEINDWENFPTQPPICGGDDGLPTDLDGITFSKWRNESIKAYGNAIVPQVVYEIFKVINLMEEYFIADDLM